MTQAVCIDLRQSCEANVTLVAACNATAYQLQSDW